MDKFDSLKSIVDKLDVDKLVPAPINLKKFKDLVDNEIAKKDVYDELVKKVIGIDTSGLVRNRLWC